MTREFKTERQKLAIGVSGGGTTMEAIILAIQAGRLDLDVAFIFTDRECDAIAKAKKLNTKVVQKRPTESIDDFHQRIIKKMVQDGVNIVALAGYLRLFPVTGADPYLVLNSHPAAIPEFGGSGFWGSRVHETVLEFAKATNFRHPYTYSTIHVASAEYDNGDILGLMQMEIGPDDTAESIAARLLPLEHKNYINTLSRLSSGQAQAFANFDDLVLDVEQEVLALVRQEVLNKNHRVV